MTYGFNILILKKVISFMYSQRKPSVLMRNQITKSSIHHYS